MNTAILLLGGNLGNIAQTFAYAGLYIEAIAYEKPRKSNTYISKPWGFEANEEFLNQAIEMQTQLSAEVLLARLQLIENIFLRKRTGKGYESRSLDIDILFFNSEIIETQTLQIPHPRLHLRNFTLKPLAELIPEFEHPVLHKTIKKLLADSPDKSEVKPI
ncbi:MAG TPA: 2-amino-4-hydroxy-6-hydroxymethyldihydropteridine diphosphokinase [Bacteroidales bacterium]|nr:2-amino-4-hydroxy-6-hydroxymethyldihydropteridine diphosphokinase [Bacteroidales bacterium]